MKKKLLPVLLLSLITNCAFSSTFMGNPDSTKNEVLSNLDINGYVDTYYSYNLNNPENSNNFGTTGVGRIFDGYHNQFALGLAQLKLDYTTDKSEVVLDFAFGPNGELANFGNSGTALVIKQAYFTTAISKKLNFTIGQYGTHIGYELVDAPENFHYSLSYLFGNGPFYHTGMKLDYALSDKVGIMAGVVNGWDAIFDNNKSKSITAQLSYSPNDDMAIYFNWIGGNESPSFDTGDSINSFKHMFDLTSTFQLSDKFQVGFNGAIGFNKFDTTETNWGGAALYLSYSLNDQFKIGVRSELFDDTNGSQYLGTAYKGFTLTGSYESKSGNIIVKPEIRLDAANDVIYYSGANNELAKDQTTVGVAFIGKF